MSATFYFALTGSLIIAVPSYGQRPLPLSDLIAEAQRNNAGLHAAEHTWRAATKMSKEVTALPDPQFTLQDFSVGSRKPFAGFDRSNFAYLGIGASQELPYPGKLRLKGQAADAAATVEQARIGVLQASITEQVKAAYFRLAYLRGTLESLESSRTVLGQIADSEIRRYSSGGSSQMDVLKAQLERTKLAREITTDKREMGKVEADLKELLHRPQDSSDIVTEDLAPTTLGYSSQALLDMARRQNPELQLENNSVQRRNAELKSAERQSKPDFSIGYMYQRTGLNFPAYYMFTAGMTLPRKQRARAEIAEATESLAAARDSLDAALQQQLAEVRKQYVAATSTADLLTEYREGLIPQADAVFHAGLAEYQSNKAQLDPVLTAFNEALDLKRQYEQILFDHEVAIAALEQLTGTALR